ncbi:MAG: 4'-phosphopantetheinyl transferase superfamily protein [Hyphomicrobiales bacterium]|nr:4'-phosphopantetheinyl transferase superfamily protein [Hyphomicrobiales bacterium]
MSEDLDYAPLRAALQPFRVLFGARRIRAGDEEAATGAPSANLARRRASGAARIVARGLLEKLGSDGAAALARLPSGAPQWPEGVVGSLAHDEEFAVAAAVWAGAIVGLGVDVEPAEALPEDIVAMVLTPDEARETAADGVARRLIFAAKEAVYKAVNPLDGSWLEFHDVRVSLADGVATLADGRRLRLVTLKGERLIAVALAIGSLR